MLLAAPRTVELTMIDDELSFALSSFAASGLLYINTLGSMFMPLYNIIYYRQRKSTSVNLQFAKLEQHT